MKNQEAHPSISAVLPAAFEKAGETFFALRALLFSF